MRNKKMEILLQIALGIALTGILLAYTGWLSGKSKRDKAEHL